MLIFRDVYLVIFPDDIQHVQQVRLLFDCKLFHHMTLGVRIFQLKSTQNLKVAAHLHLRNGNHTTQF